MRSHPVGMQFRDDADPSQPDFRACSGRSPRDYFDGSRRLAHNGGIGNYAKHNLDASSYSPELNPMEQVWQQLRKIKLANTFFNDYDDIVNLEHIL
jgi:hypothetical protein